MTASEGHKTGCPYAAIDLNPKSLSAEERAREIANALWIRDQIDIGLFGINSIAAQLVAYGKEQVAMHEARRR